MTPDQPAVAVPVGRSAGEPEPRTRSARPASATGSEQPQPGDLTPPIDIYEGAEGLVLEADLPGVSEDRLTIRLEANVLILRGEVAATDPGARMVHEEYRPGPFWRSFILSDEVDRTRINATLRNGVLRVSLPRAERSKPRRIEIRSS